MSFIKQIYFIIFIFILGSPLRAFDGIPKGKYYGKRYINCKKLDSDTQTIPMNTSRNTLVNLCFDVRTKRLVVIKASKDSHIPVLKNEARILSMTKKIVGVVRHYFTLLEEGRRYEVFEYCPKGDLMDFIMKNGRRTEDDARAIFIDVVRALACLHERKVAHLDIKMENIFLMEDGSGRLGDFGYSEFLPRNKEPSGLRVGTPYTMPFEVHTAEMTGPYDPFKADVFSLGIIMASAVLGHQVYKEPDDEYYKRCLKSGILSLIKPWASRKKLLLTANFLDLISKMTDKEPSRRPAMREVLEHPWFLVRPGAEAVDPVL